MNHIYSFYEYQKEHGALSFEEMNRLHQEMILEIGSDEDARDLYDQLLDTAIRYSDFRARWLLLSKEEKRKADESRTSCHNSVITKTNMLARYLRMQGKPSSWREELGDEKENRKRIGDFACFLVFVNAVNGR